MLEEAIEANIVMVKTSFVTPAPIQNTSGQRLPTLRETSSLKQRSIIRKLVMADQYLTWEESSGFGHEQSSTYFNSHEGQNASTTSRTSSGVKRWNPVCYVHQLPRDSSHLLEQWTPDEARHSNPTFPESDLGAPERPVETPGGTKATRNAAIVAGEHQHGVFQHLGFLESLEDLAHRDV